MKQILNPKYSSNHSRTCVDTHVYTQMYTHAGTGTQYHSRQEPKKRVQGFVQILILIIVALILLRTLNVPITNILHTPWFTEIATYINEMSRLVWSDIKTIFSFFFKS